MIVMDWNQIKIIKKDGTELMVGGIYTDTPYNIIKYGICDEHGTYVQNGYILRSNIKIVEDKNDLR